MNRILGKTLHAGSPNEHFMTEGHHYLVMFILVYVERLKVQESVLKGLKNKV